jgi:hypothetical protein
MRPPAKGSRRARKPGFSILLLAGTLMLWTAPSFSSDLKTESIQAKPESIQATYSQAGSSIAVTLVIYNYSTPSDLQVLSHAFQEGQDRGLATALSKTKAVGHCSITGTLSYDVSFIQMVLIPNGRRITFITSRPRPFDETDPAPDLQTFDLAFGQFDLNDADPAKSTGFLYPASKLVINPQGEFHYDLAGNPWSLVNVLDTLGTPA